VSGANLAVRCRRLLQGQFFGGGDQAEQLGRVLLHARQVHLREVGGRDGARFDEWGEVYHAPERDVLQIRRRLSGGDLRNGGIEALRPFDGLTVRQSGVECEGGFGIDRHVRGA
jgi:hypothetical protein